MATGALHRTKHGLIDAAHVQSLLFIEQAEKALPKGKSLTPSERIKYGVDAILTDAIDR